MSQSVRALFGVETEYAVTALDSDDRTLPTERVVRQMGDRAAMRPHLPGNETGIFLQNGGRFYIDVGHHPEYASPETTNPWDAVRYSFAGDRLIAQLAQEVARDDPEIACLAVRKGNVDYATSATWASHENYLHRRPPACVRPALIPHLVSRVVFTGGGGFDPFDRARPRFVLSPRALFVRRLIAASATGEIALVDDRAQPHCAGFHRQHLMCGDANLSQLAMFLRVGTTALVVALVDAGCGCDQEVSLAEPLEALATVARDVTLQRTLELASGRQVTAVEIQRHYLRQARVNLERLPDWASGVCDLWQDTLDRLDRGPDAVADRLDWAIKHAVYRHRAGQWQRQRPVVAGIESGRSVSRTSKPENGWRATLCEIDLRFGQVSASKSGLFDALEQAGVLRHRVAGVDAIDRAVSTPPPDGRASIRGRVVTRLAGHDTMISCGWDHVRDMVALRRLDLSNPFVEAEVWGDLVAAEKTADALVACVLQLIRGPASPATKSSIRNLAERFSASGEQAPLRRSGEHAIALNNHAFELRNAGRLEEAEWLLRAALATDLAVRIANHPKVPHRRNNLGTVLLLEGRMREAREQVTLAWQQTGPRHDLTSARILTMRLVIALIDNEPCELFLGQLKSHLAIRPLLNVADVDRHWQIGPVLDVLAPRFHTGDVSLLKAIVGELNGNASLDALEVMPRWRDTPAQELDTPWPSEPRS